MRQPRGLFCARTFDGHGCGKVVPTDHYGRSIPGWKFATTSPRCPDPPAPLAWIWGIMARAIGDGRHAANSGSVTRLLGCPRQAIIEDNVPLIFDPSSHDALHFGTATHEILKAHAYEGFSELEVGPSDLFGLNVKGFVDWMHDAEGDGVFLLGDYKTTSEGGHYFANKYGGGKEDVAQVSMYKILIEKTHPELTVKEGRIWKGAFLSAKSKTERSTWLTFRAPFMSLDEIGAFKPWGGGYTVAEIAGMLKRFWISLEKMRGMAEDSEFVEAFKKLLKETVPPVGATMMKGTKCESYCGPARDWCDSIEGIVRA